jgi:hypothetical protein
VNKTTSTTPQERYITMEVATKVEI